MPNKDTIQKNVNSIIKSYELKVVLTPTGININQDPRNMTPFEVISILEVIKQTHVANFNTQLQPTPEAKPLTEVVKPDNTVPFIAEGVDE